MIGRMAKDRENIEPAPLPGEPKSDAGVNLGTAGDAQSTPLRIAIRSIGNDRSRVYLYLSDRVKALTVASREELIALRTEINHALDGATK